MDPNNLPIDIQCSKLHGLCTFYYSMIFNAKNEF